MSFHVYSNLAWPCAQPRYWQISPCIVWSRCILGCPLPTWGVRIKQKVLAVILQISQLCSVLVAVSKTLHHLIGIQDVFIVWLMARLLRITLFASCPGLLVCQDQSACSRSMLTSSELEDLSKLRIPGCQQPGAGQIRTSSSVLNATGYIFQAYTGLIWKVLWHRGLPLHHLWAVLWKPSLFWFVSSPWKFDGQMKYSDWRMDSSL